jgi:hypothetical protein
VRYTAWPHWRNNRWELEVFQEEGPTVIQWLPLKELLNKTGVREVLDQMVAEAKLPPQPSKFELLSEPDPEGEVVPFPAHQKAGVARP